MLVLKHARAAWISLVESEPEQAFRRIYRRSIRIMLRSQSASLVRQVLGKLTFIGAAAAADGRFTAHCGVLRQRPRRQTHLHPHMVPSGCSHSPDKTTAGLGSVCPATQPRSGLDRADSSQNAESASSGVRFIRFAGTWTDTVLGGGRSATGESSMPRHSSRSFAATSASNPSVSRSAASDQCCGARRAEQSTSRARTRVSSTHDVQIWQDEHALPDSASAAVHAATPEPEP